MYYVMRASAPSLHRESTDSLIIYTAKCHPDSSTAWLGFNKPLDASNKLHEYH